MDERKKVGRTRIYEEPMTPAQLQARHRAKLREKGALIVQAKITDPDLVDVLHQVKEEKGIKSNTGAVNHILEAALKRYQERLCKDQETGSF